RSRDPRSPDPVSHFTAHSDRPRLPPSPRPRICRWAGRNPVVTVDPGDPCGRARTRARSSARPAGSPARSVGRRDMVGLRNTIAVVAVWSCATPLAAQNTVAVVEQSTGAVVTLRVYDGAGTAIGQGSGFFVDDGRIVTNTHVVEGAARVDVFGTDERLLGKIGRAHV